MSPVADPIGSGLVNSLANPGGNITGLSIMSADISAKSLEFFACPRSDRRSRCGVDVRQSGSSLAADGGRSSGPNARACDRSRHSEAAIRSRFGVLDDD
jgi:hypothetical protein